MSKEKAATSQERLRELQEGTLSAPKDSELSLTLGEAFLRVNRVDEAAASYQRAVELDPRSDLRALYWEWLGLVREMEGRLEEALEAYFQWLDAEPVAFSPLDRLGTLLVVLGRWTDLRLLEPQFVRRIEATSHSRGKESLALYTFVMEQFSSEDEENSKDVTMAALEADPDSLSMRFLLGLLTYRDGNLELARGEFERVLDLDRAGVWHEPRFALDWNSSKARVMVAKLCRQQGDVETALRLLIEAEDLQRSDSEGLLEVAELLVENHRYDDFLKLMKKVQPGPSRLNRLEAECMLGKGFLAEAGVVIKTEAALLQADDPTYQERSLPERRSDELDELWQRFLTNQDVWSEVSALQKTMGSVFLRHPVGASLILWQRFHNGSLVHPQVEPEVLELCRRHPSSVQAWEVARRVLGELDHTSSAQLAALTASKLRHGDRPGPTGAFTIASRWGTEVLVALTTDGGPLVLKLEADSGREDRDQMFGWGRDFLWPGLELAKGVLENLAESDTLLSGLLPELSHFPRSFRVMITAIAMPEEQKSAQLLADGELGSVPLGFLVALLSVLKKTPCRRILVIGRLGLRGEIHGEPDLEETILSLHQCDIVWDQLLLADGGGFRLLRAPAWLWHERPVALVNSASQVVAWQLAHENSDGESK